MDLEFVRISTTTFADENVTPALDRLQTQFNQFKDTFPGQTSEANPFGFGYKQPARLQLDYIALKLDDVTSIISRPTAEEMETYYRQYRDQRFTRQVPSDPNDPQSPTVPEVRSYVDVAETIRAQLLHDRVVNKAQQILLEAGTLADVNLPLGTGEEKPSVDALAKAALDYMPIAESLSSKYGVTLYSGRTGQLTAADVQQGPYLGQLSLTNYGAAPLPLVRMLFSVDQLGNDAVSLLSAPPAQMYRSIGPAQDATLASTTTLAGKIMAMVRIVDVSKPEAPATLETTYSTKAMVIGDTPEDQVQTLYSVRQKVVEDVRNLMAWDTAQAKANDFASLATVKGWDGAVSEFNTLYGDATKKDPNDPNVFSVDRLVGVQPISSQQLSAFRMQASSSPSAAEFVETLSNERHFINQLYSLVPADSNSLAETPVVMPYRPDRSLYCIKSLSIRRVTLEQYEQMKGTLLSRERYTGSQELAVAHFMPENITKRTQFEFVKESVTGTEDETPEATEEGS